jgi:hypothetical protein
MLEKLSCVAIKSGNPLKMSDFLGFLTREMVLTDVGYVVGPRNFELKTSYGDIGPKNLQKMHIIIQVFSFRHSQKRDFRSDFDLI